MVTPPLAWGILELGFCNPAPFLCSDLVSIFINIAYCSKVMYILSMDAEYNTNEKPWDQQDGEPSLWYGRFRSYLEMGFKRNVNAVYAEEAKNSENQRNLDAGGEWYRIEKVWNWKERAKLYDDNWIKEQDKLIAREKEIVLRTGYALMHNRIKLLNKFVEKMEQWADEDDKIWLVKTQDVTSENFSKHTEEMIFNAPMMSAISKYLDDIAKEKGERVKKQEIDVTNINDQDMQDFYKAIEEALDQHPGAKIALAEKLAEIDGQSR